MTDLEGREPAGNRLGAALREALRGTQDGLTRGPIGRSILVSAIPMVIGTALESVFAAGIAFSRLAVASVPLFRPGRWKTRQV